jgi:flagellar hook-associated protein 2
LSASLGGTNNASLWNNPQILSALLPGVNLSAMQQAMQAELNVDAIPLANMSQQLSQLQSQLSAWQALQGDLTNLQADAQTLAGSSLYAGIAATSSDTNVATVTAGGTGSPATYQLTVTNLMSPEIDNSALQSSDSTALNYTGSFSLNGTSISVSSSDTLQTIAQSINAAAAGVTATVLPSSGSYVLNLASTEGQAITWSDPNGILQGLGVLSGAQVPANQVQAAAAARYSINGVSETSVTDADSTSIPGVTPPAAAR